MSESSLFDQVAERLDELTDLSRLESRGTLRIALKKAGFDAQGVTAFQFGIVIEKMVPDELASRGIADIEGVTRALMMLVATAPSESAETDSPDAIFRRLSS